MSKGIYSADEINGLDEERFFEALEGKRITVGVDVAKEKPFARFRDDERDEVLATVHWRRPVQTRQFVDLLARSPSSRLEVVLESSGAYGDALLNESRKAGIGVFRVKTQAVNKMAEVFDGVPSLHDAKAADIVARLHQMGLSEPWTPKTETQRRLSAVLASHQEAKQQLGILANKLEGLLARHFPELAEILELRSATLLKLLEHMPSPEQISRRAQRARLLMRKASRQKLSEEKIEQVITAARQTTGCGMLTEEKQRIKRLVQKLLEYRSEKRRLEKQIEEMVEGDEAIERIAEVVGTVTAAVIVSKLGSPTDYESASAYEKAAGLNLVEISSGKTSERPFLRLSKRGPSIVRAYLYMATLRQIVNCDVFRAWHQKKVARDGGKRLKSIAALMRKLIKALYHVGRGADFDVTKLFDLSRLDFEAN